MEDSINEKYLFPWSTKDVCLSEVFVGPRSSLRPSCDRGSLGPTTRWVISLQSSTSTGTVRPLSGVGLVLPNWSNLLSPTKYPPRNQDRRPKCLDSNLGSRRCTGSFHRTYVPIPTQKITFFPQMSRVSQLPWLM